MVVRLNDPTQRWSRNITTEVKKKFRNLYKSRYPEAVELIPGEQDHDQLIDMLLRHAHDSERWMLTKHPTWDSIDEQLTAYIPTSIKERASKSADIRTPVSIVVPELYSNRETLLTYLMTAFSTDPMFRYEGVSPDDVLGTILLEKVIEFQVKKSKALLTFHNQWSDGFGYGIGIIALDWRRKTSTRIVTEPVGLFIEGEFIQVGEEEIEQETLLYEGNWFTSIDPLLYLPDPNVEIYNVQDGEYVGWLDRDNYTSLLRDEANSDQIFNVRFLRDQPTTSSIYKGVGTGRDKVVSSRPREDNQGGVNQAVDVIYLYMDIIPDEWNLGEKEVPEKWLFAVAGDNVIITAHPLDLIHDDYPVAVCAPDFNGHELLPTSRLELMFGFQEIINFLLNSHIYNVRKSLKNRMIVDPLLVNMKDLQGQKDIIRTRPPVWGRGVAGATEQLKVTDVTQNHLRDLAIIKEMTRGMSGAVDSLQGLQRNKGEKVSATEFRDTRMSALSRLQKTARLISIQSMTDIGKMVAFHTQQFMSNDTFVRITGRTEDLLREEYGITDERIAVSPAEINVAFDTVVHDGSIEGGEKVNNWLLMLKTIGSSEELSQTLDISRIFLHIARLLGADNVQDFIRKGGSFNMKAQGAETISNQAQAGNIVPIGATA